VHPRIVARIVGQPNHTCGQHHNAGEIARRHGPIAIFNEYRDFSSPRQGRGAWWGDEGCLILYVGVTDLRLRALNGGEALRNMQIETRATARRTLPFSVAQS
jgi:hypothetical protein